MKPTYIILDLEATGLAPEKGDVILDVAAIKVFEDGSFEQFQSFVHPGRVEIPEFIQSLTGITPERVKDSPTWDAVKPQLVEFLGEVDCPLIGHNVGFDVNFLRVHGVDLSHAPIVDTYEYASLLVPEAASHSLEVLASGFELEHGEKHTALADVLATFEVLKELIRRVQPNKEAFQELLTTLFGRYEWHGDLLLSFPVLEPEKELMFTLPFSPVEVPVLDEPLEGGVQYVVSSTVPYELAIAANLSHGQVLVTDRIKLFEELDTCMLWDLGSMVRRSDVSSLKDKEQLSTEEVLLLLRLEQLPARAWYHFKDLSLTRGEKRVLRAMDMRPTEEELLEAFAEGGTHVVSYGFYLAFASLLEKQHLVFAHAEELTFHLLAGNRSSLNVDVLQYNFDILKEQLQSEGLYLARRKDEVEVLQDMCLTWFERAGDAVGIKNTSKAIASLESSLLEYSQRIFSAFTMIAGELPKESPSAKRLAFLKDRFAEYFVDVEEGMYSVVFLGIQGPQLIKEPKELRYPSDTHTFVTAADSLPKQYTLPTKERSLGNCSLSIHTLPEAQASLCERDDLQVLSPYFAPEKKVLVLVGSSYKAEELFAHAYHSHGGDRAVMLPGKTGSVDKCLWNIASASSGVLFLPYRDLASMKNMQFDMVLLHHVPFPAVFGPYFEERYGRSSFTELSLPLAKNRTLQLVRELLPYVRDGGEFLLSDPRYVTKRYGSEVVAYVEENLD